MYTLREIADHLQAELVGDPACKISRITTLASAKSGDISFLSNAKYAHELSDTHASAVILRREDSNKCHVHQIHVQDPYLAFAKISKLLNPLPEPNWGIHPTSSVHPSVKLPVRVFIGAGATIEEDVVLHEKVVVGPGCVVGRGCILGEEAHLAARVTLYPNVILGKRVVIHGGAVIGADGFGFAMDDGRWLKIPQVGGVKIGDDVEIGANTTIDRGALEDTVIEEGVKIDNLVQIGHNVRIGAHTIIAGCAGIAGSAKIGRYCMIGGGSGIGGHIEIADKTNLFGYSIISKSITKPGQTFNGHWHSEPHIQWARQVATLRQLVKKKASK